MFIYSENHYCQIPCIAVLMLLFLIQKRIFGENKGYFILNAFCIEKILGNLTLVDDTPYN